MRAKHVLTLVIGAGVLTGMAAVSGAAVECLRSNDGVCGGRTIFAVNGEVRPKVLPVRKRAPVAVRVRGTIRAENGSHPPAFHEVALRLDRNVVLDPTAFPVCEIIHGSTLDLRHDLSVECPDSIVGRGTAEIAFASGLPPKRIPLTFFNAGVVDGVVGLAIQSKIFVPLITGVQVERARKGRYGYTANWLTPPIAGGDGSLTKFDFRLKHGYVRARCADGKLQASIMARFKDEGSKASTTLSRIVVKRCAYRSEGA